MLVSIPPILKYVKVDGVLLPNNPDLNTRCDSTDYSLLSYDWLAWYIAQPTHNICLQATSFYNNQPSDLLTRTKQIKHKTSQPVWNSSNSGQNPEKRTLELKSSCIIQHKPLPRPLNIWDPEVHNQQTQQKNIKMRVLNTTSSTTTTTTTTTTDSILPATYDNAIQHKFVNNNNNNDERENNNKKAKKKREKSEGKKKTHRHLKRLLQFACSSTKKSKKANKVDGWEGRGEGGAREERKCRSSQRENRCFRNFVVGPSYSTTVGEETTHLVSIRVDTYDNF